MSSGNTENEITSQLFNTAIHPVPVTKIYT